MKTILSQRSKFLKKLSYNLKMINSLKKPRKKMDKNKIKKKKLKLVRKMNKI